MGVGGMGWLKKNGAVLGVLVLLGALVVWYLSSVSRGPETQLRDRFPYVCVETGEVFEFRRGEASSILPIENPKTKRATLLPCSVENGTVAVSQRCRSLVKELGVTNKVVDPESLKVAAPKGG